MFNRSTDHPVYDLEAEEAAYAAGYFWRREDDMYVDGALTESHIYGRRPHLIRRVRTEEEARRRMVSMYQAHQAQQEADLKEWE